jgi:DNA-binding beta-propeller fold protein YncE
MTSNCRILSITPGFAIPGGEVLLLCEGFHPSGSGDLNCEIGGAEARIVGGSGSRVLAIVPEEAQWGKVDVILRSGDTEASARIGIGRKLAGDLHMVANPAVDPKDGSIVLTRSGSRGQELPVTLFRLDSDGFLSEMPAVVMNPTGVAFDPHGRLVVSNRADGEVVQINNDSEIVPLAADLGVATGIAFDVNGDMFVGDRNGTVFRIGSFKSTETWAVMEPSVSAYHLAFGSDGSLFVSAPGLCSHDVVYRIDTEGSVEIFFKGLGRPQGIAFDHEGNLYVAACLKGSHGIVKIAFDGSAAEIFVAGMGLVGLCFSSGGTLVAATGDSVYSFDSGIRGSLLEV